MKKAPTAAELGEQLKAQRSRLGGTQQGMSERYGVDLRTYQRWEAGDGVRAYHVQLARTWPPFKKGRPQRSA